jgi:hypothetical protein
MPKVSLHVRLLHPIHNTALLVLAVSFLCPSLTYLRSWALLEKPPIVQPLKNFPTFYGTRRFITVFTRALHWSLSWARSTQSTPSHPIPLRSILILSTHLRLGLPRGLLPSGFPPISYMHSSSPPCVLHALPLCPSQAPIFPHSTTQFLKTVHIGRAIVFGIEKASTVFQNTEPRWCVAYMWLRRTTVTEFKRAQLWLYNHYTLCTLN